MHSLSRFIVLKCFQHAERVHGVTDESRKGGASILASGLRGEFVRAGELFSAILERNGDDAAAEFYRDLSASYAEHGPHPSFEGEVVFDVL